MAHGVFWTALGVVSYTYIVFPLVLFVRALARRPRRWPEGPLPSLSVVIAARNEAAHIGQKLQSILDGRYPIELVGIIVASDGSDDGTDDVVRGLADRGVRLISLPPRGKAAALRAAVAEATGDVLVFTDGEGILAPDALRELTIPFSDPSVGGVAGDHRYLPDRLSDALGVGERRYRAFDRLLKVAESRGGNVISAAGALYAIRRELYESIPDAVTDDAFLSMGVIEKGYQLVFAPDAIAIEPLTRATRSEFRRKVRVVTRGLRTVWLRRRLLNPMRYGFYSLELFSHKVLRRIMGVPLLAMLIASALLWGDGWLFRAATLAQVALYGLGIVGLALSSTSLGRKMPLALPAFFVSTNVAALIAFLDAVRGRTIASWQPERSSPLDVEPIEPARTSLLRSAEIGSVVLGTVTVGVLTGLRPVFAGLAVFALLAAVVLLRPRLTTLVAIALIYSNAIVVAIERHGAPAILALTIPALLSVKLVHRLLIRREALAVVPALPFVIGYLAVQAASAAQARDTAGALASVGSFAVEGLGLFLVVTNVVVTRAMLSRCVRVILVLAAVLSAFAVVRAATGEYGNEFLGFAQAPQPEVGPSALEEVEAEQQLGGMLREAGPIGDANRFAQYLLPLIPLGLGVASLARTRLSRSAAVGAVWLVLGGVILTFSRGAFLALALTVVLLVVLRQVNVSHLLAGISFLLLLVVVIPAYRERVVSLLDAVGLASEGQTGSSDSAIRGRFTENAAAALAFADRPVLGLGPGNFESSYRQYANEAPARVHRGERRAHNAYLEVAAETGVLGVFMVLGVFFATLRALWIARRRAPDQEGVALASKFITVVIGLMVTSVFLHFSYIRYFWLFMALASVAARVAMRPGPATTSTEPIPVAIGTAS